MFVMQKHLPGGIVIARLLPEKQTSLDELTFAYGINNTNKQTQPFLRIYVGSFYSGQGGTPKIKIKAHIRE